MRIIEDWKLWADRGRQAALDEDERELSALREELETAQQEDPLHLGIRQGADVKAALMAAARAENSTAALEVLQKRLAVRFPGGRDLWSARSDRKNEPVLRGIATGGSVLRRGEVCVLSGAGGKGKSTLALQWALTAAVGATAGLEWTPAGGLEVWPGRSAILSYEDDAKDIADRAFLACRLPSLRERGSPTELVRSTKGQIQIHAMRGWPLFGVVAGDHHAARPQPLQAWNPVWHCIRQHRADLVIIDPAMSAYCANSNAVEFVRLFLDNLIEAARVADCGVLVVAHSTKAARRGKDADETGYVSGSAAWTDAARGVLLLKATPQPDRRVLSCEKANHSRPFQRLLSAHTCKTSRTGWHEFLGFEDAGEWKPSPGNPYA